MKCTFCDLVNGKKKSHLEGYPYIPLKSTKYSVSFLAADIPAHEEGHLLVIPKKHFRSLEDMPPRILHDVIEHVSLASKVTRKRHSGCNILLNNGKAAGQHEMHVHFHVIPRDPKDRIKVDVWKTRRISNKKYERVSEKLKKDFKNLSAFS
ncbi:HIT family protein [Nanoarchaeota archaeon]